MNIYSEEYLREWEVREEMFINRQERDRLAKQLRREGWEVTSTKMSFEGKDRFFIDARRKRIDNRS